MSFSTDSRFKNFNYMAHSWSWQNLDGKCTYRESWSCSRNQYRSNDEKWLACHLWTHETKYQQQQVQYYWILMRKNLCFSSDNRFCVNAMNVFYSMSLFQFLVKQCSKLKWFRCERKQRNWGNTGLYTAINHNTAEAQKRPCAVVNWREALLCITTEWKQKTRQHFYNIHSPCFPILKQTITGAQRNLNNLTRSSDGQDNLLWISNEGTMIGNDTL